MSTTKTNWANATKSDAKAIPITKTKPDRGERANGIVEGFKPRSYSTGSFGVEISYTVEGVERKVYENIVLKTLDPKTGNFKPTQYGEQSLKRRLQAFGLDSDSVNNFPIPVTPQDAENGAYNFQGTHVVLYLGEEEYMGKPKKRVNAVFPQDK